MPKRKGKARTNTFSYGSSLKSMVGIHKGT